MEINAALAADLAILSEALDDGADLAYPLRHLARGVQLSVGSYLGLRVLAGDTAVRWAFTVLEPFAQPADVATSLSLPMWDRGAGGGWRTTVILYAGRSGAFVDLAADLSALTGRPLLDFVIDQHLATVGDSDCDLRASSLVNQAIGVLIGRGRTPEAAEAEIDARAAVAGVTRAEVAEIILAALDPDG